MGLLNEQRKVQGTVGLKVQGRVNPQASHLLQPASLLSTPTPSHLLPGARELLGPSGWPQCRCWLSCPLPPPLHPPSPILTTLHIIDFKNSYLFLKILVIYINNIKFPVLITLSIQFRH